MEGRNAVRNSTPGLPGRKEESMASRQYVCGDCAKCMEHLVRDDDYVVIAQAVICIDSGDAVNESDSACGDGFVPAND
jgi:hypothetical protein